jgi:hypothetical protein
LEKHHYKASKIYTKFEIYYVKFDKSGKWIITKLLYGRKNIFKDKSVLYGLV